MEPKKRVHADGKHSWHAVVSYVDGTGRRRQRRVTAPTKQACRDAAAKVRAEGQGGVGLDARRATVGEYLARWLDGLSGVAESSRLAYARQIDRHVIPALGAHRLARLSPLDVRAFVAAQEAAGYAPRTIRGQLDRLRQACADAVRWGLLPRNPCDGVSAPRPAEAAPRVWTAAEARAFLAATAGDPLHAAWLLALGCGLRIGELAALTWGDVDLEAGTVTVGRTMTRDAAGREVLGTTTKGKRPRALPLPGPCVAALRAAREARPGLPAAPLFPSDRGGHWQTNRLRTRFVAACRAAGVPPLTPHGLRHTTLTWLDEAGVPARVAQAIGGHAAVAQTLRYGRRTTAMERAAADALAGYLGDNGVTADAPDGGKTADGSGKG